MKKHKTMQPLNQDFFVRLVEQAARRSDIDHDRLAMLLHSREEVDGVQTYVMSRETPYGQEGMPISLRGASDLLKQIHEEQRAYAEATKGNIQEFQAIEYFKDALLGKLDFQANMPLSAQFLLACDRFADDVFMEALLEGMDDGYIDSARRFLREIRRGYAEVDGSIETMTTLKRIEDKFDIGQEAYDRITRRLESDYGASDFFSLAMREAEKILGTSDELKEEKVAYANDRAQGLYTEMLNQLGFDNARQPEITPYSIALLQLAEHAAQAEFLRLPKERRAEKETPSPAAYVKIRAPELLKQALAKYPPVQEDAGEPSDLFTHDVEPLFAAVKWLQGLQRAAGPSRA